MTPTLQPIPGLLYQAKRLREAAAWNRTKAKNSATDPRTAHEAGTAAEADDKAADSAEAHARSNVAIINAAELLIHDLLTSSHQSPSRILAMREIENAVMRLRRELGDPPAPSRAREIEHND